MAAFLKFTAKVGQQSISFSNTNFAKGELFSELPRVLPACLSFTVTNMNGIEIIVQFFYAFFGQKRQADRAFSIHLYRYEIKSWVGFPIYSYSIFSVYDIPLFN